MPENQASTNQASNNPSKSFSPLLLRKIIWALDISQERNGAFGRTLEALRALTEQSNTPIEPVYVFSPNQVDLGSEVSGPLSEQLRPAAERILAEIVSQARIPNLMSPQMITHPRPSVRSAVDVLVAYAQESGADLIVVNTQGRHGLSRFLIGSFAETLLLQSTVPVLTVGPHSHSVDSLSHILFPTDFSLASRKTFKYMVRLAKTYQSKITLFHCVPNPIEPIFQSGIFLLGGAWIPTKNYFDLATERRHRHAKAWADWACQQGVPTEPVVIDECQNIAEGIIETATEREANLVAMAAQSGRLSSLLIGSVTRQVVRNATCPVWVLHAIPEVLAQRTGVSGRKAA